MKVKVKLLFALTCLLALCAVPAVNGGNQVLIILSSDNSVQANGAFEAAQQALKAGNGVTLLLVQDGAKLASAWNPADFKDESGKKPIQIISRLIKEGVDVQVCPRSIEDCKMKDGELLCGVECADPKNATEKATKVHGLIIRF